jgi:hypothetical protein
MRSVWIGREVDRPCYIISIGFMLQRQLCAPLYYVTVFVQHAVEKSGRKVLLIAGQCGMIIAAAILAAVFYAKDAGAGGEPPVLGNCAVGALILFVSAYSVGYGPVTWVIISGKCHVCDVPSICLASLICPSFQKSTRPNSVVWA